MSLRKGTTLPSEFTTLKYKVGEPVQDAVQISGGFALVKADGEQLPAANDNAFPLI